MRSIMPSTAVSFVGRHNSGKTTTIVAVIAELTKRGFDVGSIKHHSHPGFDIDIPGKDSYRHRQAGATETIISAPGKMAMTRDVDGDAECDELVALMPGHDIVLVEGYRKSGLPSIEIMRAGNASDQETARAFAQAVKEGRALTSDPAQEARADSAKAPLEKMPTSATVAIVTDIEIAAQAADEANIPVFGIDDYAGLCDFLQQHYIRPHVSVVIQAGGESKRMGQDKALVPFLGRPLIMRIIERLADAADELVITTNDPEGLSFVQSAYPGHHIRLVKDELDIRGALPGLLTAFSNATCPLVAVVACDMVFCSNTLVVAEAQELIRVGADAVVPANKHGFEPMHAVYRREACLNATRKAIEDGKTRAQDIYHYIEVSPFTREQVQRAEPKGGCFVNANTPEELRRIEASLDK